MRVGLTVLFAILLSGCARKHISVLEYQFRQVEGNSLLFPPGAQAQAGSEIVLSFPKLRRTGASECELNGSSVHLNWKGKRPQLRIDANDLGDPSRVPLSLMNEINRIRQLSRRCFKDADAGRFMNGIIEGMPLPPHVAYTFRYGGSVNQGYIDIDSPFRMKVVAPTRDADSKVRGFETAHYDLRPRSGGGFRLAPERVEHFVLGKQQPISKPDKTRLTFPPAANYYRLFFLTRRSARDHDILVLAARAKDHIESATPAIQANGESACASLSSAEVACVQVPLDSAISAELRVLANGRHVYIPLTGNVMDAMRASGMRDPREFRGRVQVKRPFAGKLIPVVQGEGTNVLGMVLIGGEEITWK